MGEKLTEMGRPVFLKNFGRCFLATFDVFGVLRGVTEVSCWINVTIVEVRGLYVVCVYFGMEGLGKTVYGVVYSVWI